MAKLSITLTNDTLSLISNIRFNKFEPIREDDQRQEINYAIDLNSLYGGSYVFEDISYILGLYDKHIEGTEEDAEGPDFPSEVKDYMWQLHSYILENLESIEELVHQFSCKGGLTEGTYTCKSYEHIWYKK